MRSTRTYPSALCTEHTPMGRSKHKRQSRKFSHLYGHVFAICAKAVGLRANQRCHTNVITMPLMIELLHRGVPSCGLVTQTRSCFRPLFAHLRIAISFYRISKWWPWAEVYTLQSKRHVHPSRQDFIGNEEYIVRRSDCSR
jgi:hypothetical protein